MDRATQDVDREQSNLAHMIGTMKTQDRQFRDLCWAFGIALMLGLVGSPFLAGLLPLGLNGRIAALVMMQDRWNSGEALMRAGNPAGWAQLTADTKLVDANRDKIKACRDAVAKTKSDERCAITVKAP